MAKLSADELIEAFKEMTLIELSDFVKQFEEVFDVEAAAPAAAVVAAPAALCKPKKRPSSRLSSKQPATRRLPLSRLSSPSPASA